MNGVLLINKPKDYTSHDIVNIVRKKLKTKKVGHTGTLDPNATGVLPILIGSATKISKYLIEHKKTYIATIKLGKRTETGDSEGKIIEIKTNLKRFTISEIEEKLNKFNGKQQQIPPMYSAIKINGKKLYEYARENKSIDIKPREIEIYNINLISYQIDEMKIEVECSKVTYIRTLSEDIAKALGTVGYMKDLIRIKVDEFKIEDSISIEELEVDVSNKIITVEEIFKNKPKIDLNNKKNELFLNGVLLSYEFDDGLYRIYKNNNFIGLGIVKNKLLKRDVII